MNDFITAITNSSTGLTELKFFSFFIDLVPFFAIIVPIALGVFFLGKILKEYYTGKFW